MTFFQRWRLRRKVKRFDWEMASKLDLFVGDPRYYSSGVATLEDYVRVFEHMGERADELQGS